MAHPITVNLVVKLTQHCRAGCQTAVGWETFMALLTTLDFFIVPISLVAVGLREALLDAEALARSEATSGTEGVDDRLITDLFIATTTLDVIFLVNVVFEVAQAFVGDLGFHDTPVDRIVESVHSSRQQAALAAPGQDVQALVYSKLNSDARLGRQLMATALTGLLRQLFVMAPRWLTFAVTTPYWVVTLAHLVRVTRLQALLRFFSSRQEDLATDIRWVAAFKFAIIIFATAHWLGCLFFFMAIVTGFTQAELWMNWVDVWTRATLVDYGWATSGALQTYVIVMYKGFRCGAGAGVWYTAHSRQERGRAATGEHAQIAPAALPLSRPL